MSKSKRRPASFTGAAGLLLALAVLLAGCGGTVPASRYFVIQYEVEPAAGGVGPDLDLVLGVEAFSTQPLYRDRRIAYRVSQHEVVYYPYRYWAAAPGELVADRLANHLRRAHVVRAVETAPYDLTPDWLLGGQVQQFEEVVRGKAGFARLELSVRLEALGDRKILREEEIAVERPVLKRTPEAVAEAMSGAVREAGERIVALIREEGARRGAGGAAGRSAVAGEPGAPGGEAGEAAGESGESKPR